MDREQWNTRYAGSELVWTAAANRFLVALTPEEVAEELPGLRIERAERVRRPVAEAHGAAYAIDALVRATRDGGA